VTASIRVPDTGAIANLPIGLASLAVIGLLTRKNRVNAVQ
jgi:hypothetical protein